MKKKLYINACRLFSLLAIVTLFVACDAHRDFPDTAMKPCHILYTDGKVLSVSDFKQSEKQRELLRQFDGDDNGKQYDQRKTFIDKVKELFDK